MTVSCVGNNSGDDPLGQHMGCRRVSPATVPWPQTFLLYPEFPATIWDHLWILFLLLI